jgi:hypothetical protein
MATDKSEPRVGLIFRIGLLVIVLLVSIRGALISYFDNIAHAEEQRKVGEAVPEALIALRADEDQRLKGGAMPIDKAMQDLAAHGRMAASPDIMPSASRDFGPMQGWSKMPGEVPPTMTAPPPPAPAEPTAAPKTDAGAPVIAPPGAHGTPKKPNKK